MYVSFSDGVKKCFCYKQKVRRAIRNIKIVRVCLQMKMNEYYITILSCNQIASPCICCRTGLFTSVGPGRDRGAWGMNAATRDLCVWLRIEFQSRGKTKAHFPSYGSVRRSKTAMPWRPRYSYFDNHYQPLLHTYILHVQPSRCLPCHNVHINIGVHFSANW